MGSEHNYVVIAFQFHFGTIDRIEKADFEKLMRSFNSTLVRLIVTYCWAANIAHSFQFHFGTIDSR